MLTYTAGPSETNDIVVRLVDSGYRIEDSGAAITAGDGCTSLGPHVVRCSAVDTYYAAVVVMAGDGNDRITVDEIEWETSSSLYGGNGNDTIIGSAAGQHLTNYLFGGAGNDVLRGRAGSDTLAGGAGSDWLSGGTSRSCVLAETCPLDRDTVTYRGRATSIRVDFDGVADDGEAGERDNVRPSVEAVLGGAGNDTLVGGRHGDQFQGGPGDDKLFGLGGADRLEGAGGADVLVGGDGRDTAAGGADNDVIRGGPGADGFKHAWACLCGGDGDDLIVGGSGRDWVNGNRGRDALYVRDGEADHAYGAQDVDRAVFDRGLDRLHGVEGAIRT